MEITLSYTERHNKALDLYRHEEEMKQKRFCDAYTHWSKMPEGTGYWFRAREEAWQKYLTVRLEWTGF